MKKLSYLFIAVILAGLTILSGCNKDNDDDDNVNLDPVLEFIGGVDFISQDVTKMANAILRFGIRCESNTTSGKKLTNFKLTVVYNNVPTVLHDSTFNEFSYNMDYEINPPHPVGEHNFIFRVTDTEGKYQERSIIVTIEPAGGLIYEYNDGFLGSYASDDGSSFAAADGTTYDMTNAIANSGMIDWMYSFGASAENQAVFMAPADNLAVEFFGETNMNAFATRNETKFKKVTETVDWDNIVDDVKIVELTASGVDYTAIKQLAVGDIIAFITDPNKSTFAGKKGLIKVIAITTGGDGDITFEVKVQQ